MRPTLACIALIALCLGGCPTDPGTTPPGPGNPADLAGTWRGDVTCTRTESLGSVSGNPNSETVSFEITFDDNGIPTELTILGFAGAPDQVAQISAIGENASQNAANGALVVDQTATVTSTSITSTEATFGISIDYAATGGVLSQDGTGTQTITATVSGDTLTYEANADYSVQQTTGPIELDTGEEIRCSGTLSRV